MPRRPRYRAADLDTILTRLTEQAGAATSAFAIQMDGLYVGGHAPVAIDADLASALIIAAWSEVQRLAKEGLGRALELVSLTVAPYRVTVVVVRRTLLVALWAPLDESVGAQWLALEAAAVEAGRWLTRSVRSRGDRP